MSNSLYPESLKQKESLRDRKCKTIDKLKV